MIFILSRIIVWMKMGSFAAALVLGMVLICSPVRAWKTSFECPQPDEIHPCTCHVFPKEVVKCDDVTDFSVIQSSLENKFPDPIPYLEITNVQSFHVPSYAFRNITAKRLKLKHSNINSVNDEAFADLDSTGLLMLADDRLTEVPSKALKRLPHLRTMSLAGNYISKVTADSFSNLPQLRVLVLTDNMISQIERGSFSRTLHSLSIARNLLTTLNGTVKNLAHMELLFVSGNQLASVKGEFGGLTQLYHLDLEENNLVDIDGCFDGLSSLRSLNLAYNKLDSVADGLYPLKQLRHLNLSYNYLSELDSDIFRSLNRIDELDLSGNLLTNNVCNSIKPLTGMEHLRLSNMGLTKLDFDCFRGMKNLRTLDLSGNELTEINAVLGHAFPKLLFLHVQNNRIFSFKNGLKYLQNLYELDISANNLSTFKSYQFKHMAQLKTFIIEGNPWECTNSLFQTFRDLESRLVKVIGSPLCYLDSDVL